MKPKAKYKKSARILPLFNKFRTTKDLAVFFLLFTLFSFYVYFYYLGSLLIDVAKSGKGYTDTKGVCEASLLSNLSSLFTEGIGVYRDFLKDSGIFLRVLEKIEEDQLSRSKFDTVYLSGDFGDIGHLHKKTLKVHGFNVQAVLSNEVGRDVNVSERVDSDTSPLWICLGERRPKRRDCRRTSQMTAKHLTALTRHLSRRENFCNTINILRKCAADKTKLWTSLPLCFVLPEHTQQFRDVAEALGSSSVVWKLESAVDAAGKHRPRPQKLPATVLADARLLEKA